MIRSRTAAPLLLTIILGTTTTTQAQSVFKHLAGENYGGGWDLTAGADGGVRLVSSLTSGGELVLDEAGNIIGSTILTDDGVGQPLAVREMVQVGATERLALGQVDNGTGTLSGKTIFLARITDGATSTEAVAIGTEDNTEWAADLALTTDGAVVLGRTLFGVDPNFHYKTIVAKFDADLAPQWGVSVDVSDKVMQPIKAFVDPASGAITCYSLVYASNPIDAFGNLVKFSSAGELLWSYSYDCVGSGDIAAGIVQTEAGDFYTLHRLADNINTLDLVLSKITADGELLWSRQVSSPQPGRFQNLHWHNGALYALATTGYLGIGQNALLVKLDPEGQVQWAHVYGMADRLTIPYDVLFTTGTNGQEALWMGGVFRLDGASPQDILWMKLNGDGTGMDCTLPDYVFTTTPTTSTTIDDGVAAPYTHFGTLTLGISTFAADAPVIECAAPDGIAKATIALAQVAPVPTHGPCDLTFPAAHGALRIRVLNALGQPVQEVSVAANAPTLQLDLGSVEAGTYVLLIEELKSGRRSAQRVVKE